MILRTGNGVAYYQFEHLAAFAEINHGIFARTPGHSLPPFQQLNVSLAVGDDVRRVEHNRRLVARCMQAGQLVFAHQVHGDAVLVVEGRAARPFAADELKSPVGDAMVTAQPGQFLVVTVADCQPILMYDPRRRVVANVHSGWRGNVTNVAGRTLAVMAERFGCDPADVRVGIGPSLGPCCAEFVNYRQEIPRELWGYRRDSVYFDFWAMSRDQLTGAGVPQDQIHISGLCTKCRTDRFFSYRGERQTGRFPAVIGLRQQ
ncbi:MAG: peptidoglycan editing factor PgeF [Hyphomicrobiales bacterium]